jgi:hypothetical protein
MNRRHFFRQAAGLAALPLTGWALSGCSSPEPGNVSLGESTCEYCRQVIKDKRFAAQIRDAEGAQHLFDDFGCAVRWMQAQTQAEDSMMFWVMDYRGGYWINAFKAHFHGGKASPKGYDLAAATVPGNGGRDYAAARAYVLARPE